ncbi:MAG: hypothetical protein GY765_33430 [bacterium]|nr:hypothetical protein [bacterium]
MTNGTKQAELLEMEAAINFFYDKFSNKNTNFFDLLGLAKTATQKEIVTAYTKYSEEFSTERVSLIGNSKVRKKGEFLMERGKRAYTILCDYEKRAEYEKRGFKEAADMKPKEEDPEEMAKIIYKKAKSLKTMKQYSNAVLAMEEVVKLDPSKPAYYLLLGVCQTQIQEHRRKAEENLLKAAEMESWNAEPFAALGMLFYSVRLFKRAESYFRKALELEPSHALAKEKLGEIVGPEAKAIDMVQNKLKKFLPSIFGKKK